MYVSIVIALFSLCLCSSLGVETEYVEAYYDQKIDHFNFETYGSKTFKQRYLYNDTWWERGVGPIFFYAGNEGPIDQFWENSGFIMELAPKFKALVVFVELRFFGQSLPFGNASFDLRNIGVMSVSQTLADYAFFLKNFKQSFNATECPVIAFGGSYGGILAAYMRFKFPNIIDGAIAASAPIYLFAGKVSGDLFFQQVTKAFQMATPDCESLVRSAFNQVQKWAAAGQTGLDMISRTFLLCEPLTSEADVDHLLRWAREAFIMAALMNYPYATTFLNKFPAYPVKVMCDRLAAEETPAAGLRSACGLAYNASENKECFDIYQEYIYCSDPTGCGLGSDAIAWDYQCCTELNVEADTNGVADMFPKLPYNSTMRDEYCLKTWKVKPRRDWIGVLFWGENIASASNIVFSNGDLDPCFPEGVLKNISDSLVSVIIQGGAHHLDLRGSNPADPPSVISARDFEARNIQKWISEFHLKKGTYLDLHSNNI